MHMCVLKYFTQSTEMSRGRASVHAYSFINPGATEILLYRTSSSNKVRTLNFVLKQSQKVCIRKTQDSALKDIQELKVCFAYGKLESHAKCHMRI